ncbi:hypothetical protein SAMN05428983_4595 [Agrobacterium fabrum]|uniref:Uncharacterized protein n=1 Tax=Agrobacterium fabrum TaxID=1176649 RepID=A0A7Z7BRU9_9HYPH|nr:hypothetical protein SAMN05428983_4595 [Agrobacterium fabrum]
MPYLGDSHRMDSEEYWAYVKTRLMRNHAGISCQGLIGVALAAAVCAASLAFHYPTTGRRIAGTYSEFVSREQTSTPTSKR